MRYSSKLNRRKNLDLSSTDFNFDIDDIIKRLYNIKLSGTTMSTIKKLDFSFLDWKFTSNPNHININDIVKGIRKTKLSLPKHSKLFKGITRLTKEEEDIIVNKSFEYLDNTHMSVKDLMPCLHNIDETCTDPYEYTVPKSGYESDIDEYVDYPDLEDICDLYHGFE